MKIRLYRASAKFRGYIDEFTLYFPHPKWMQKENYDRYGHHICGYCIGCSQSNSGNMIRCIGFDDDRNLGYHPDNFGRRYPLEKMSKEFQAEARKLARAWNNALKYNDDKHWEVWNRA